MFSKGVGLHSEPDPNRNELLVEKLPCVGPVKPAHADRGNQRGIEIAEVHPMPCTWLSVDRLPVGDAPTSRAANVSKRLIAPDILGGVFWMASDLDRAELEVDPRPAGPAAQRAVALDGDCRRGRQGEPDRAAVA